MLYNVRWANWKDNWVRQCRFSWNILSSRVKREFSELYEMKEIASTQSLGRGGEIDPQTDIDDITKKMIVITI